MDTLLLIMLTRCNMGATIVKSQRDTSRQRRASGQSDALAPFGAWPHDARTGPCRWGRCRVRLAHRECHLRPAKSLVSAGHLRCPRHLHGGALPCGWLSAASRHETWRRRQSCNADCTTHPGSKRTNELSMPTEPTARSFCRLGLGGLFRLVVQAAR